jgi:hypothetical protein
LNGFLAILGDTTPSNVPCTLEATITASAPVNSFLVCKANGEKDLVLWQSITASVTAAPATVSVSVSNPGMVREYVQDVSFHWLEKDSPNIATLSANDRPIIVAFHAVTGVSIPPLPSP